MKKFRDLIFKMEKKNCFSSMYFHSFSRMLLRLTCFKNPRMQTLISHSFKCKSFTAYTLYQDTTKYYKQSFIKVIYNILQLQKYFPAYHIEYTKIHVVV